MDNPTLIQQTEVKISEILLEAHTRGLSYEALDWMVGQLKAKTECRKIAEKALNGKPN